MGDYLEEIDIFDKLGAKINDPLSQHLIPLQLTFKHGKDYFLMFPWADGNLKHLWRTRAANPEDPKQVSWFIAQCSGIVRGLRRIHHITTQKSPKTVTEDEAKEIILGAKVWGIHGDIKPENILWFENYNSKKDHLVISDFALTQFNSGPSRSGVQQGQIQWFSGTYRPPDLHIEGQPISQNYDVWSLGCVFLEFLSWFLLGYNESVYTFSDARLRDEPEGTIGEDTFFVLENDHHDTPKNAKLKGSVVEVTLISHIIGFVTNMALQWIHKLHKTRHCSEPLHELLDLIQFTMLVPDSKDRWKSDWLYFEFQQLDSKCKAGTFVAKAASRGPDPSRYRSADSGRRYRNHPSRLDDDYTPPPLQENASTAELLVGMASSKNESVGDEENALHMEWEQSRLHLGESKDIQDEQPTGLFSFQQSANTRFSKDSGGAEHVGHSEVGSGTDFGRTEPWTDSGYASLGKDTAPTSVGNSILKEHRDEFDCSQVSDYDENDAATVYTAADSVPEADLETYKLELSRAIFEAVRPYVSDIEQLEPLSSLLPALLQSFALRLGCPSSSTEEWKIMYFVHKHRKFVSSLLGHCCQADNPIVRLQIGLKTP